MTLNNFRVDKIPSRIKRRIITLSKATDNWPEDLIRWQWSSENSEVDSDDELDENDDEVGDSVGCRIEDDDGYQPDNLIPPESVELLRTFFNCVVCGHIDPTERGDFGQHVSALGNQLQFVGACSTAMSDHTLAIFYSREYSGFVPDVDRLCHLLGLSFSVVRPSTKQGRLIALLWVDGHPTSRPPK